MTRVTRLSCHPGSPLGTLALAGPAPVWQATSEGDLAADLRRELQECQSLPLGNLWQLEEKEPSPPSRCSHHVTM